MAVFYPHSVQCACGNVLSVHLADSINAKRAPEMRDSILRGELHRAACPACSRQFTVEKPFYYLDLERNALFRVAPRNERHTWKTASAQVARASEALPEEISHEEGRQLRVVFGMDELREKLVAQDASFDDRTLELLKVLLVYEHPVLLRKPRLRLSLTGFDDAGLQFLAAYEHSPQRFAIRFPAATLQGISGEDLQAWAGQHQSSVYELPDHWVNMWRWSPQPGALDTLKAYAQKMRAGEPVDLGERDFEKMLERLPRGTQLPSWAKQDLRTVFEYVKENGPAELQEALFEIRFGFELEDDWAKNEDPDDIDTLWTLLKDLPDSNVEGNTKIHELLLDEGKEGGWYQPGANDIAIGSLELANQERFEDVVRHEVGHAVHEMRPDLVNGWLMNRFGWEIFGTSDEEVGEWMDRMGFGPGLSMAQKSDVRHALLKALGTQSSWEPGPRPVLPPGHPWNAKDFGPRLAYENTGASWYRNHANWYRRNGKAFFLNYWYKTLMVVDVEALDLVTAMPSAYASMSHFEFFAELYALYYDLDDAKRKVIPQDVRDWMDQNVGAPDARAPMPAGPREAKAWEGIARP